MRWLTTNARVEHKDSSVFHGALTADEKAQRYWGVLETKNSAASLFDKLLWQMRSRLRR